MGNKDIVQTRIPLFHVFLMITHCSLICDVDGASNLVVSCTGARGTDLPPPFFLTFCLQIYFQ